MRPDPKKTKLVLASSSPRRKFLLEQAGFSFDAVAPRIEEVPRSRETPAAFARRAAREKAEAVQAGLPPLRTGFIRHVLGCDTVVALGSTLLGKPADASAAAAMLRRLSGRTHEVITGLCLLSEEEGGVIRRTQRQGRTEVRFRRLARTEIDRYVESGEPMDKAGAYGIQGAAAGMVRWIRGSYTNVVGLPMAVFIDMINRISGEKRM